MNVIGMAVSLVPQLLFVALTVVGLVLLAQLGAGQPWARLAQLGLTLLLVGSLVNLVLLGGLTTGVVPPIGIGPLYWLVGLLGSVLHWAGIGLLVAAVLSGRPRSRPGAQSWE